MIQFILLFVLTLFLSSIFINGFFLITKGEWLTKPDGSKHYVGMIFKAWSKNLLKHNVVRDYFKGPEFVKQFAKILNLVPVGEDGKHHIFFEDTIAVISALSRQDQFLLIAEAANRNVLITIRPYETDKSVISIYEERKEYKYPELIRMPFGGCITCMSSAFGAACFMFWYFVGEFSYSFFPTDAVSILLWSPFWIKACLLIFFCISLAWVNEIIFNINHKLKQ